MDEGFELLHKMSYRDRWDRTGGPLAHLWAAAAVRVRVWVPRPIFLQVRGLTVAVMILVDELGDWHPHINHRCLAEPYK